MQSHLYLSTSSFYSLPTRGFSAFSSGSNEEPPEVSVEGAHDSSSDTHADASAGAEGLTTQYRLVPVRDHPIFPGSSMATAITKEQYEVSWTTSKNWNYRVEDLTVILFLQILKDVQKVFVSVV